jgi:hypothetical protein
MGYPFLFKNNLFTITLIFLLTITSQLKADKPPWTGIWAWGNEFFEDREQFPWYKGYRKTISWSNIETADNQFYWDSFDAAVYDAAKKKIYMIISIYHGLQCPSWIYSKGIPKVKIDGKSYPYYLHPDYIIYLKRMLNAFAEHMDSFPPEVKQYIVGVEGASGKSGDPQPYVTQPDDPKYQIDPEGPEWIQFSKEVWLGFNDAFTSTDPPTYLFLKGPAVEEFDNWAVENLPGTGRKTHSVAQGFQLNNEMLYESHRLLISQFHDGYIARARGETTHAHRPDQTMWFKEAPIWNNHFECLWMAMYGMDALTVRKEVHTIHDLDVHIFAESFEYFNKYAGYKDPRDSKGVWCALRDGLDSKDTLRFPEAQFGAIDDENRETNIANAFADYGALQEEPNADRDPFFCMLNTTKMNDVGYNIWPGNYRMFLYQYDPNGTSQGYWRQGPLDQPYGRFARGFDHESGKDTMYFDIDNGFFFDKPHGGEYQVKIRVVYLDKGTGTWSLRYDAIGDPQKTALSVKKTNSNMWKQDTVTIDDGYFGNRCPNNTDIMLVNTDAENDIFHMVELMREEGDRKGYWGNVTSIAANQDIKSKNFTLPEFK